MVVSSDILTDQLRIWRAWTNEQKSVNRAIENPFLIKITKHLHSKYVKLGRQLFDNKFGNASLH